MLERSLKQHTLHPAKSAVPFLHDLALHLKAPQAKFKTPLVFGLQFYWDVTASILIAESVWVNTEVLRHLKNFLRELCTDTVRGLTITSTIDPSTRSESQQLLSSLGIHYYDPVHIERRAQDGKVESTEGPKVGVLSEDLDIWSLSH